MMYWHLATDARVWAKREKKCRVKLKRKGKGKRKKHRQDGCEYSGEFWETVQDFHYLWCKWSGPIIRPLISLSFISSPSFSIFLWSMEHSLQWREGCCRSLLMFVSLEAPRAWLQRLLVPIRINLLLIRARSISLQDMIHAHNVKTEQQEMKDFVHLYKHAGEKNAHV